VGFGYFFPKHPPGLERIGTIVPLSFLSHLPLLSLRDRPLGPPDPRLGLAALAYPLGPLQLVAALKSSAERELIGVLKIAANRQARGELARTAALCT